MHLKDKCTQCGSDEIQLYEQDKYNVYGLFVCNACGYQCTAVYYHKQQNSPLIEVKPVDWGSHKEQIKNSIYGRGSDKNN